MDEREVVDELTREAESLGLYDERLFVAIEAVIDRWLGSGDVTVENLSAAFAWHTAHVSDLANLIGVVLFTHRDDLYALLGLEQVGWDCPKSGYPIEWDMNSPEGQHYHANIGDCDGLLRPLFAQEATE